MAKYGALQAALEDPKVEINSKYRGSAEEITAVLVSLKEEDNWKLASTEQWPCDPRFRKFIVAYMSPRTRQLVFHSVTDPIE